MMFGTIARWGFKGFGFVEADGLPVPAWTHIEYMADPGYQPKRGDRVEFDLVRLADGRLQARRVRPVGQAGVAVAQRPPEPVVGTALTSAPNPMGTLAEKLAAAGVVAAPVRLPVSLAPLGVGQQVAARRREREAELTRIEQHAEHMRLEAERLQARAQELAAQAEQHERDLVERRRVAVSDDATLVAAYLSKMKDGFERAIEDRGRRQGEVDRARRLATDRVGVQQVADYDEVRKRIEAAAETDDRLTQAAFEMLEKDRRAALRDYALALDMLAEAPAVRPHFVAFTTDGTTTLVAPIRADAPLPAGAVATRVACAFWQAADRAATELGESCAIDDGVVSGLTAVRFPLRLDPSLLEVLIDETISTRPSLEAMSVEPEFEMAEGVTVAFDPAPEERVNEVAAGGGEPGGRALPAVAVRLGLSLRDAVAALHDHGLPFPDDVVDEGAEKTLGVLLGEAPGAVEEPEEAAPAVVAPPAAATMVGLPGNLGIASRMLAKLLRDRRVGGRHTRMDNVWAHHFADSEKQAARRIAEWLERDGIFIPKNNEGSHHISIDPRRLRDVREIIEGTWGRREDVERV